MVTCHSVCFNVLILVRICLFFACFLCPYFSLSISFTLVFC